MCLTRLLFNRLKNQVSLVLVGGTLFALNHDELGILKPPNRMVNLSWLMMVVTETTGRKLWFT